MEKAEHILEWIFGILAVFSSLGVILAPKPVYSGLSFLLTLLALSAIYFQLSAQFIGVMQILVYAGAILVIFMFVIVLFQDAHRQIDRFPANSAKALLVPAALAFSGALVFLGYRLIGIPAAAAPSKEFGTAQALGQTLYVDFFFPFEAVILMFLIAVIGALFIGKKEA